MSRSFGIPATGPADRRLRRMVGADGLVTLALSSLVIVATAGMTLAWALREVHQAARSAPPLPPSADTALVLGFRLHGQAVSPEFAGRLARASRLYQRGYIRRILVLGGRTDRAGPLSEAEQGRRFLIGRGLPAEAVLVEEDSVHTLENLRNARAKLKSGSAPVILVTSRYHLARSLAMAAGFGLKPVPCPAEDRLAHTPGTLLRLIREAFFLHWYRVGSTWSRWTGNASSLARIS